LHRTLPFFLSPVLLFGCSFDDLPDIVIPVNVEYDQEMRYLVEDISVYAKDIERDFIIIPLNGIELITTDTKTTGQVDSAYVKSTDGIAQEAVFYGQNGVDQPTSKSESDRLQDYLDLAKDNNSNNNVILVTDFASREDYVNDSYEENEIAGYISFAADQTNLADVPLYPAEPFNVDNRNVYELNEANNFLSLTNTGEYSSPQGLVDKLSETNYDLIIIDFFFDGEPYTKEQIEQLKVKENGGDRLVMAYVNIGEAQENRYYWQSFWPTNPPAWLLDEVPNETGNYYVEYWKAGWQDIIYGNNDSYIYKIVDAGFDGAYMDGIDAFEYFDSLDTDEGN